MTWELRMAPLGRIKAEMSTAANRGLLLAGELVLRESRRLVPHEEGTLERSGKVTPNTADVSVSISYGTEYAVVQHEDLSLRHDAGRSAKFLEIPLNAQRARCAALVAEQVRRRLGT